MSAVSNSVLSDELIYILAQVPNPIKGGFGDHTLCSDGLDQ